FCPRPALRVSIIVISQYLEVLLFQECPECGDLGDCSGPGCRGEVRPCSEFPGDGHDSRFCGLGDGGEGSEPVSQGASAACSRKLLLQPVAEVHTEPVDEEQLLPLRWIPCFFLLLGGRCEPFLPECRGERLKPRTCESTDCSGD